MKKTYLTPLTDVVKMQAEVILAGSSLIDGTEPDPNPSDKMPWE